MQLGRFDRADDRAPYRQIAGQLRAQIDRGDLMAGDKLPSEAALMDHYAVARMTARQAIQELRSEGRVVAERGRGAELLLCRRDAYDAHLRTLDQSTPHTVDEPAASTDPRHGSPPPRAAGDAGTTQARLHQELVAAFTAAGWPVEPS